MEGIATGATARLVAVARRVIEFWALLGGVILLGVALMSTWSAAAGALFGTPLPGDFELVEVLVALAAFSFLPLCQLTGANVTADIFTAATGRRTLALLSVLAGVVALGFGLILLWRMYAGLLDYRQYVETTTILRFPIWIAYIPALMSLVLLVVAALITLGEAVRDAVRGA